MSSKHLNMAVQTPDGKFRTITDIDCPYISSKIKKEISEEELGDAIDVIIAYMYQKNEEIIFVNIQDRDKHLAEEDRRKEKEDSPKLNPVELLGIIKFIEKYDVSISFSRGRQDNGIVVDLRMPKCGERTYAKLTYYNIGQDNNLIYHPLSNDVIMSDIYNTLSEFYKEDEGAK